MAIKGFRLWLISHALLLGMCVYEVIDDQIEHN